MLQTSNLQFNQLTEKKKQRRPSQPLQNKKNGNLGNLREIRPQVQQINSEISFIIFAETTPKKMAIPSRRTKPETRVAFHKHRVPLFKTTTKTTKT